MSDSEHTATRQVGITGDTPIYTGYGLVPIEQLWQMAHEKKLPLTFVKSQVPRERELIVHIDDITREYFEGHIIQVKFSSGLTLRCTPDQLIRRNTVHAEWKAAGELRVGEQVKRLREVFAPTIPTDISEDLGYLIGFIYGDGHLDGNRIQINQSIKNKDLVDHIVSTSPYPFSLSIEKPHLRQLEKYTVTETKCRLFSSNATLAGKCSATLRPTINQILMVSDNTLASFLAVVVDSDGDLNRSRGRLIAVRLYPTNEWFDATVLLYALRRFGIAGRIRDVGNLKLIEVSGEDCTCLVEILRPYSLKINRKPIPEKKKTGMPTRKFDHVVAIRRVPFSGYVYNLRLSHKLRNYAASLVFLHN